MSKRILALFVMALVLSLLAAQCAAPTPATVVETVVVKETVEVVKEVEVEVPVGGELVTIGVWAFSDAEGTEDWRGDGPVKAAAAVNAMLEAEGREDRVVVEALNDRTGQWGDYKKKFTLAADAGEAPDIVLSGHEDVPVWANAGYIVPFDTCRESFPEYDDVIEALWNSGMWQGQVWAVPQDTEARPMFFNKVLLKELGWSDEEIAALPDKIRDGEFTLDDLIATAKEAVDQGVVEPGHGYWHRPRKGGDFLQYYFQHGGRVYDPDQDKLVVTRQALIDWYAFQRRIVEEGITPENYIGTEWAIWHDTVVRDGALFWNGGIWQWADWVVNYAADLGGAPYLFEHIGYALQPSGKEGVPAGTLSHPLVYMITSESASGKNNQDLACAILAKTTTAEINTLHAVGSTHLGIVKSQMDYEPYTNDRLLSETLYMLDYNYYQPNHVMYGIYYDIVWDAMVKAENGDLSPEAAADEAINLLQAELGDQVIIE